jgi:hypothetical protein
VRRAAAAIESVERRVLPACRTSSPGAANKVRQWSDHNDAVVVTVDRRSALP